MDHRVVDLIKPLYDRECLLFHLCIFLENGLPWRTYHLPGWYMEPARAGAGVYDLPLDDVVRRCHDGAFEIVLVAPSD